MSSESALFPVEPPVRWSLGEFDEFLAWVVSEQASDVSLEPMMPIWARIHGSWRCVTRRKISNDEIAELLDGMARTPSASAQSSSGGYVKFAHEIRMGRGEKTRFRGIASGVEDRGTVGINVILRTIPGHPPTVEEIGLEPELLAAATPDNGLVLVTGVMGNGKSTTLAAILRHIAENEPRAIHTFEDPIEFDLNVPGRLGPLTQSEVPRHFPTFREAPALTARRASNVVLIGESRERETLRGMIEMAEIGVAAYSTVHTRSVEETPTRIINVFPREEQNGIATTLISSLRLIVQQRLPRRVDRPGRVALRSWLSFTPEIREDLLTVPVEGLIPAVREHVRESGRTLLAGARDLHERGIIDRHELLKIEAEEGRGAS